jgi:DNA-binding LacI/PurR family transcriptional regulator
MSQRAITILDIAHAAGVSRTTASAALGGSGRISAATREHVQAVAQRLGYRANPAARHLQAGRKGAIAYYLADVLTGYAFYLEVAVGAAEAAREEAFALTLLLQEADAPTATLVAHVDGYLVVDPIVGDPGVPALLDTGLPVVCAERYLDDVRQPHVTVESEHREAFRELLDHVWERGARAPALLGANIDFAWKRLIEQVYDEWCARHGLPPRLRRIEEAGSRDEIHHAARELLEGPDAPDAIIAAPDGSAVAVTGAIRDAGLSVGTDVLLASGVDSLAMRYALPAITALDLGAREIGRDAARVLLRLLHGEAVPPTVRRGRPTLRVRDSTRGRA